MFKGDFPLSLSNLKDSANSKGGTDDGGVEKCKELAAGPDIKGGAGCLQNEVAFRDFNPDFAAACWNIAIAAGFDIPCGNLPAEELNAPLSCWCCLYSCMLAAVAACARLLGLENIESIDDVEVLVVEVSAPMEV